MNVQNRATVVVFVILFNFFNLRYEKHTNQYEITNNYASASELISPTKRHIETWGVYFRGSPRHDFNNITSEVVMAKPSHACSSLTNSDETNGRIVLIDSDNCDPQVKAKHAQKAKAIGIIIAEYLIHPPLTYLTDGKNHPDLILPTVQITSEDFKTLNKYLSEQIVVLTLYPDPNPWDKTYGNQSLWISLVTLVIASHGSICVLACYRLYQYKTRREKAKAKLVILILLALFCVVYCIGGIDPIGSFGIYSYKVSTLLTTISFPFGLTIYFLLVLYWAEVTKGFIPNFTKVMKPFAVVAPLFFLVEFISWIPRFMFYDTGLILFGLLMLYIIGFTLATVFYLKNGIQIIMAMNKRIIVEKRSEVKMVTNTLPLANNYQLTFYILFIAGCHAVDTMLFILLLILGIGPVFNPCLYWLHFVLTLATTLSEVLMFPNAPSSTDIELALYNGGMYATQSSTLSDTAATGSGTTSEAGSSSLK